MRRPDYRTLLARWMRCGHERTPENTASKGGCRTCQVATSRRWRRRATAPARARARARKRATMVLTPFTFTLGPAVRTGPGADDLRLALAMPPRRPRKPWLAPTPSVLAVIEACRVEYEAAIALRRPVRRDSRDPQQSTLSLGAPCSL